MIQFRIPRQIPSGNATMWKGSRWAYVKERDAWYTLIRSKLAPQAEPPTRLMYLVIRSYRPRMLDLGNLWSGTKPIPDALVRLNYLKDDNPKWCTCRVEQIQVPAKLAYSEIIISPEPIA